MVSQGFIQTEALVSKDGVYVKTSDIDNLMSRQLHSIKSSIFQVLDKVHICVALPSSYNIINVETGRAQDLFTYDSDSTRALIKTVSRVSADIIMMFMNAAI